MTGTIEHSMNGAEPFHPVNIIHNVPTTYLIHSVYKSQRRQSRQQLRTVHTQYKQQHQQHRQHHAHNVYERRRIIYQQCPLPKRYQHNSNPHTPRVYGGPHKRTDYTEKCRTWWQAGRRTVTARSNDCVTEAMVELTSTMARRGDQTPQCTFYTVVCIFEPCDSSQHPTTYTLFALVSHPADYARYRHSQLRHPTLIIPTKGDAATSLQRHNNVRTVLYTAKCRPNSRSSQSTAYHKRVWCLRNYPHILAPRLSRETCNRYVSIVTALKWRQPTCRLGATSSRSLKMSRRGECTPRCQATDTNDRISHLLRLDKAYVAMRPSLWGEGVPPERPLALSAYSLGLKCVQHWPVISEVCDSVGLLRCALPRAPTHPAASEHNPANSKQLLRELVMVAWSCQPVVRPQSGAGADQLSVCAAAIRARHVAPSYTPQTTLYSWNTRTTPWSPRRMSTVILALAATAELSLQQPDAVDSCQVMTALAAGVITQMSPPVGTVPAFMSRLSLSLRFKVFDYSILHSRCVIRRQLKTPTSMPQATRGGDPRYRVMRPIPLSNAGRLAGGHPSRQHQRHQRPTLCPQHTTPYPPLTLVRVNQPLGLLNIGNSCFMNATLQCHLALKQHNEISTSTAIPTIMYTGTDHPLISQIHNRHAPLPTTLESLLLQVTTDKRWTYGSQQDAAEFLTWLHNNQSNASPRLECHDVRWVAYCDQCFSNTIRNLRLSTWILSPDHGDTVQTCVDRHGGPQELTCCERVVLSTNRQQQSYGRTLWVQINRSVGGSKNVKYIYPNMVLSVGTHTYDLVGIVEHVGAHAHEGHYIAYVNHGGSWFKCDDQVVTPLPNLSQLTPQVYLAVYKQTTRQPLQLHAATQQHHFAQVVARSIPDAVPPHTVADTSPLAEGRARPCLIVTDIIEIDTLMQVIPQPEHVLVPIAAGVQPAHPLLLEIPFRNWPIASASMFNTWGTKLSFHSLNLILAAHGHHQTWLRSFLRHHLPHLVREGWLQLGAMVCLPRSHTVCTILTAEWSHLRLLLEEALPTARAAYTRMFPQDHPTMNTTYDHDAAIWLTVRNPRTLTPTQPVSFRTTQAMRATVSEVLTTPQVITGSSEDGRLSIHTSLNRITDLLTGEELQRMRSLSTPMEEIVQLLSRDQHTHYALRLHLTPNEIQGYGSGTPALGHCALLATHQLYERHKGDSSAAIAAAYPVALDLLRPLGRARYLQWLEELSAASTPEAQETLQCIRLHLQHNPHSASLPFELWYSGRHIVMNRLHFPLTMWQHDHLTQGTCQLTYCSRIPHTRQSEHSLTHLQQALNASGNLLFAHHHYCPLPDFEFGEQLLASAFGNLVENVVCAIRQERVRRNVEAVTLPESSSQDATLSAAPPTPAAPPATALPPTLQSPAAPMKVTIQQALKRQGSGQSLYPPDRHGRLYPSLERLRAIQHLSALSVVKDAPLYGGKGLFAPHHDIPKGQWIGTYTGLILDRASALTDTYLMQVRVDGQTLTIDGTPTTHENTDFTKIARINEFIWHAGGMDANVWLTPTLDAYTSTVVKRGEQYFLNYGDSYNWRPLIHRRNLPLLRVVLKQLGQHIPADYRTSLKVLLTQLKHWSIEDMDQAYHGASRNHALVAYVAYGHLKCFQRHLHHFADTTCFDDWLEMTLTNEVVYRNIAFRHAYHPSKQYHYSVAMVKHRAATHEPNSRQRPVRQATFKIRSPECETDLLTPATLAPYPRPTWIRRVFITNEPTHHRLNAYTPTDAKPPAIPPAPPLTGELLSANSAHTYVQYRPHGSQPSAATPIIAELPSADFLHLPHSPSTQGDQHITGHMRTLVMTLANAHTAAEVNDQHTEEHSSVANSTPTEPSAALGDPQLDDLLPAASQTTPNRSNAVSRFTGNVQVLSPHNEGERVGECEPGDAPSPPPPPHPPPTSAPSPTPESIATEVQRLNHLADHYAPVYRSKKEYERWVNTYIHNIGGLTQAKQVDIGNTILAKKIDVVILLDTRITQARLKFVHKDLKIMLAGFHVVIYPTTEENGVTIGGAVVITSPRVRSKSIHQLSPHGSLVEVTGSLGASTFAMYGVYVPQQNDAPGALASKISKTLAADGADDTDPFTHLKDQLHQAVTRTLADKRFIMVGGDFNASLLEADDPHDFRTLFHALQLTSAETNVSLLRPTYINGTKRTRIDHLLTSHPEQVHLVAIHRSVMFQQDHAALLASVRIKRLHDLNERWILPLKQLRREHFDGADADQVAEIQAILCSLPPCEHTDPSRRLQWYTDETMKRLKTARAVRIPPRHKLTKFWCPENVALDICLRLIVSIRTLLRHEQWTKQRMTEVASTALTQLEKLTRHDDAQLQQLLALIKYNPRYWQSTPADPSGSLRDDVDEAYKLVKKELNLNLRRKRRQAFLATRRQLDLALQTGRLRTVINYAIGSKKRAFTLETLTVEGNTVSDPGSIAYHTKVHFTDWFTPKYPKPIAAWLHLLTNRTAFYQHAAEKHVPEQYADLIWQAVAHRPTDTAAKRMFQAAVRCNPSYDRFVSALRNAPRNTAGGISGLTYDLMRQWPEHVIKDVYAACCELWQARAVPIEWTRRWVHLIPKVDNPSLDQLRPICLLEVIRKLWVGLIVDTISDYIYSGEVLTPGQQSGKHRGTDAGSAELSATLETAKRNRSQVYITSWDVRRAFDSVQRGVLLFSWTRLGVPEDVANYLIDLDVEAVMVVKNPLTLLVDHHLGFEGLQQHGLTFHPRQGTPQGGNEASLGYIGFSDILLRALTLAGTADYLMLDVHERLHPTLPNAYVDDLNSVSSSLSGLQHKANVVSAFCNIFCIELNANKFRAFHVNWGNAHGQPDSSNITIHTDGWHPTDVHLATDGSLTHLGLTRDCHVSDRTQFYDLFAKTSEALNILVRSSVSVAAKLMILQTVIYPRIRYVGKGVCWALNTTDVSYIKFDKLIFAAVRKITLNRPTFPSALIEMAPEDGGLGLPRISIDCQLAKLADLRRAMTRSPQHRHTMMALVNNVFKSANQPLVGRQVRHRATHHVSHWWLTSALTFLHTLDLTITVNNQYGCANTIPLRQQLEHINADVENSLYLHNIATHQELYMEGDDPSPTLQRIITELAIETHPVQSIPLRSEQTWMLKRGTRWTIHQLMGRKANGDWDTIQWIANTDTPQCQDELVLPDGIDTLNGAGGDDTLPLDVFSDINVQWRLVTLSKETYRTNRSHTCRILDIRQRTPWVYEGTLNPNCTERPSWQQWLADARQLGVFTDGSFRRTGTTAHHLLGKTTTHCQSSIVKQDVTRNYAYVAITNDSIQHSSSYTTELIAQLIALRYSNGVVHTDCLSAIEAIKRLAVKGHPLLQLAPPNQHERLIHVPAHPELIKAAENYTPKDKGIFLADAVAGGQLDKAGMAFDTRQCLILSDVEALNQLSVDLPHPYVSNQHGHLNLVPPLQLHQQRVRTAYLKMRDDYKPRTAESTASPSAQWQGTSFAVAHQLFKKVTAGARRAQIQRIIFDWHRTGRNRLKETGCREDAYCQVCETNVEETQCHIIHRCPHPDMHALREEHKTELTRYVKQLQERANDERLAKTITILHDILMREENCSMLFGRIHVHQQRLLDQLPFLTASGVKQLLAVWKNYAAMVIDLYVQRQIILAKHPSLLPKVYASFVGKRVPLAREVMEGIDATTTIHLDGTKVTNTKYEHNRTVLAHKRTDLTAANSIVLRTMQTVKTQVARKQPPAIDSIGGVRATLLSHPCNTSTPRTYHLLQRLPHLTQQQHLLHPSLRMDDQVRGTWLPATVAI